MFFYTSCWINDIGYVLQNVVNGTTKTFLLKHESSQFERGTQYSFLWHLCRYV